MQQEIDHLGLYSNDPSALTDDDLTEHQLNVARQHFWLSLERVRRQYAAEFPTLKAIRFINLGDAGDSASEWGLQDPHASDVPLTDESTPVFHLQTIAHAIYQDGFGGSFVLDLTKPGLLDPFSLSPWLSPATQAQEGTGLWRTVYAVEVLSDRPLPDDLAVLAHAVIDGGASGLVDIESRYELSRESMALRLVGQGSDPEFLVPGHDADW